MATKQRLPNGQRTADKLVAMPPIHGQYPHIGKTDYKLKIYGLVEKPLFLTFNELVKLGEDNYTVDFHCVTTWSKLDQEFTGVNFKKILDLAKPLSSTTHVIWEGLDGYSTNTVLSELLEHDDIIIATKMDNADIPDKFGGPVRAVLPFLYGWKSCKHLVAIRFTDHDEPGFWEVRGYHNHGDPWKQERYGF